MGTWTTPKNRSSVVIDGMTVNIGDLRSAGLDPFSNIPSAVLAALGRNKQAKNAFNQNPLALGTSPENTYIDNSFAQTGDNIGTCAAKGLDFDPITQQCVPRTTNSNTGIGKVGSAVDAVLNAGMGGIDDLPILGDIINKGAEGLGKVVGGAVGKVMPGYNTDVIIDTDGNIDFTITPPNSQLPTPKQTGVPVSTTRNSQGGNTTVTVDTGTGIGNIILGGGRVKDVVDVVSGQSGEGQYTQTDLILQAACMAQGKDYDYTSGTCIERFGSMQPPGTATPSGTAPPSGTGNDSTPPPGGNTTVTIGASTDATLCADPIYAIGHPVKCRPFWDQCSNGEWALKGTCPDSTTSTTTATTTAQAEICPENSDKPFKTIPAGQTVAWCTDAASTASSTASSTSTAQAQICPENSDKPFKTIPAGQTIAWCTDAASTPSSTATLLFVQQE